MSHASFLDRLDRVFERWGERFNPIVVKETRQAISSRAFPYAFMATLLLCVIATTLLILSEGDRVYYQESGLLFFGWYLGVLLLAICLVVPLGLFRSVVSEFDGQTFEMLAITTLSPRKVVFGKLKSAILQMGAFYSAVAPFVCFTYLLQGVSIPGLVLALAMAFLCGLSACMGAMMFGALGKQSGWQVFCLLLTVVLGIILLSSGVGSGLTAASELFGWAGFASVCVSFGCVGYTFVFFSLLTVGVSIAQFTPTMPRAGHVGGTRRKPVTQRPPAKPLPPSKPVDG